jgi:hypothetical protein
MQLLCTGLSRALVGDVGKRGRVAGESDWISKIPDFNKRNLENAATYQTHAPQLFRLNIHFS